MLAKRTLAEATLWNVLDRRYVTALKGIFSYNPRDLDRSRCYAIEWTDNEDVLRYIRHNSISQRGRVALVSNNVASRAGSDGYRLSCVNLLQP
jgi:hypothetical protein